MNWGVKIAVLYIGFVALIVTMVSMTMREKVDLVSSDYYQKEINFQKQIDQTQRAKDLGSDQLDWAVSQNQVVLDFPEQFNTADISAEVLMFRPSDASLDKKWNFERIQNGEKAFPTKGMKPGYYKIQVSWEVAETTYYNEGFIQIP